MSKGFDDLDSASSHGSPVLRPVGVSQKSRTPPPDIDMLEPELEEEPFNGNLDPVVYELFPDLPRYFPLLPVMDRDTLRWHTKMDLPLLIRGSILQARPDTGCGENIISSSLASKFGLFIDRREEHRKEFRVANGGVIRAISLASVSGYFPDEWREMRLEFYVFPTLITQIVMGMSFLEKTGTLIENRHRLRPRKLFRTGPFQVSRLSCPKRWVRCMAESLPALAIPDTGSDIDLMSLAYVAKRGFEVKAIDESDSMVQFADGSTALLSGSVTVSLAICSDSFLEELKTFYVLQDLTCDILLGKEFLYSKKIFENHGTAFTSGQTGDFSSEANTILWKKKPESRLARLLFSRGGKESTASASGESGDQREIEYRRKQHQLEEDARELHRRELAAAQIQRMDVQAPADEARRMRSRERLRAAYYDQNRTPNSRKETLKAIGNNKDTESSDTGRLNRTSNSGEETLHLGNDKDTESSDSESDSVVDNISDTGATVSSWADFLKTLSSPSSVQSSDSNNEQDHRVMGLTTVNKGTTSNTAAPNTTNTTRATQAPEISLARPVENTAPPITTSTTGVSQAPGTSHAKPAVNRYGKQAWYYCSVSGCPRESNGGGSGFREIESVGRHERGAHNIPHDFICPFCPGGSRIFPRQDRLQRHVRVWHTDRSKDDPELLEAIAAGTGCVPTHSSNLEFTNALAHPFPTTQ